MSIALVGDSVLDNFYWLNNPRLDVRQQLANKFPDKTVYNFAVDETKVMDILKGFRPYTVYQDARQKHFRGEYPYPVAADGKVYPLKLLRQEDPEFTVVSAGGNDGRVHLSKLAWSAQSLIDAVLENGIEANFKRMLRKVQNATTSKKMIIVLVYKPHETVFEQFRESVGWGLQYLPIENVIDFPGRLDEVYAYFRQMFIKQLKELGKKVAVIDLARSFNPKDRSHYGSTPIEPSNKSGQTIADLIEHVILNHNFDGPAIIYHAPNCSEQIYQNTL